MTGLLTPGRFVVVLITRDGKPTAYTWPNFEGAVLFALRHAVPNGWEATVSFRGNTIFRFDGEKIHDIITPPRKRLLKRKVK